MTLLRSLSVTLAAFALAGFMLASQLGCESTKARNDFIVDVAVSQGVARYVGAASSTADAVDRRERLISALSVARQFVSGDEPLAVSDWADDFIRLMDWDSLSVPDQILVAQVLELIRQEIEVRAAGDAEVKIYLGRLIDVAINTARTL